VWGKILTYITETEMTLPEKPEPSVLDYLKGRLFPKKNPVIQIPDVELPPSEEIAPVNITESREQKSGGRNFIWLLIIILLTLLAGQKLLEPPFPIISLSLIFWGFAAGLVILNWLRGNFETNLYTCKEEDGEGQVIRPWFLTVSLCVGIATTILFTRNRFTTTNLSLWAVSILCLILAFTPGLKWNHIKRNIQRILDDISHSGFRIHLSPWLVVWVLSFVLVLFFHLYRLEQVPLEMISDHAEKLLDVNDVLGGKYSIFFVRNTGREAFQMYLSAAVALIFKTGISFTTLKIGTTLMGIFMAVYMYFLGKELGNKWVGLFAFLLSGIGYWPNVLSRIGLRFILYPAFLAPALYHFFKGIRRKSYLDLMFAGIFVGIGLQGYSPYRVVPVLLAIGLVLYLVHFRQTQRQVFAGNALFIIGLAALILFLPLLRYMLDQPEMFSYRTLTRIGSIEQPLPGPAWQIFLSNLWRAIVMPFYKNGSIWVHSVPNRPALDVVGGALFFLGLLVCFLRYKEQRDWRIPFMMFSIPFLMLPSIVSLAFPEENPCLNRTAGAMVPIFLITAMGLDTLLHNIRIQFSGIKSSLITALVGVIILSLSVVQNFNLVFDAYNANYIFESRNTSQVGQVIRDFVEIYGDPDSAYVVGYPHWVDTRLVGINAGYPTKDYALWPEKFDTTLANPNAKLFIINQKDTDSLMKLRQMYPDYFETRFRGWLEAKDFVVFLVPPAVGSRLESTVK